MYLKKFNSKSFKGEHDFSFIGNGSLGAKAGGLSSINRMLQARSFPDYIPNIEIVVPGTVVITTEFFERFMQKNHLCELPAPATDDYQIGRMFHVAKLPEELIDDLRVFIDWVNVPLAVRSSSLLEDGIHEPFAGVYAMKMIPNSGQDTKNRLQVLESAIKYVYASIFFKKARDYLSAVNKACTDEKMAVIIQEAVGESFNGRFYPHLSGIARSYNFYSIGLSLPEDGVAGLALGLGKIIVDDGIAWYYSPEYPHANPPYKTFRDLLNQTQKIFWAIDLKQKPGQSPDFNTEYLKSYTIVDAEQDGALTNIASTYKAEDDKIIIGTINQGPRILDFAKILKADVIPLKVLLRDILRACEKIFGTMVSIEFALTFQKTAQPHRKQMPLSTARFGFLQVRPMEVSDFRVEVETGEMQKENVLLASDSCLGNGVIDSITDIVYLKPDK